MDIKMVSVSEIDAEAIKGIRPINTESEGYKILEYSIQKDGQQHPITIRVLSEDEQSQARDGAKYGIIDGHHRYAIACRSGATEILAMVHEIPTSQFDDMVLALRLNESAKKMSPLEKGEVIYKLIKLSPEQIDIGSIGEQIFGLKTAMAYRCVQEFKKSIGEDIPKKPDKKHPFMLKDLKEALDKLPKKQKELEAHNVDDCILILNAVKGVEKRLRLLKRSLLVQKEHLERLEAGKFSDIITNVAIEDSK